MRFRSSLAAAITACALLAGCGTGSGSAAPSSSLSSATSSAPAAVSSPALTSSASSASAASTSAASSSAAVSSVVSSSPAVSSALSAASSSAATSSTPATAPRRIVSLSPTATEDLFAIGAGSQVVAVDSDSTFPATAPKTNLSAYKPNVEAIAKYKPDLVVLSDDIDNIQAQLKQLSIPVMLEPAAASLDEAYQQIEALGSATGHSADAGRTVAAMRSGIAALVGTIPRRTTALTYYHELDNTLYTVSSKTFVGQIYALAGLKNVADASNGAGTAYPQLSAEYLVKADPDLVFLADTKCCQQTAATFGARPGFSVLSAVKNKQVVLLDDDVASRWGPRVVDLLKSIVGAVKSARS